MQSNEFPERGIYSQEYIPFFSGVQREQVPKTRQAGRDQEEKNETRTEKEQEERKTKLMTKKKTGQDLVVLIHPFNTPQVY